MNFRQIVNFLGQDANQWRTVQNEEVDETLYFPN